MRRKNIIRLGVLYWAIGLFTFGATRDINLWWANGLSWLSLGLIVFGGLLIFHPAYAKIGQFRKRPTPHPPTPEEWRSRPHILALIDDERKVRRFPITPIVADFDQARDLTAKPSSAYHYKNASAAEADKKKLESRLESPYVAVHIYAHPGSIGDS